jgi:hypothetical protein
VPVESDRVLEILMVRLFENVSVPLTAAVTFELIIVS